MSGDLQTIASNVGVRHGSSSRSYIRDKYVQTEVEELDHNLASTTASSCLRSDVSDLGKCKESDSTRPTEFEESSYHGVAVKSNCHPRRKGKTKKKLLDPQPSPMVKRDSRLSFIDQALKKKWSESEVEHSSIKQDLPSFDEKHFPDLTSALNVLSHYVSKQTSEIEEDQAGSSEIDSKHQNTKKKRNKQPRKKDPISINILDILKESSECRSINCQIEKRSKQSEKMQGRKLGGNLLDSSNPIRKRGKHREKPPKKRLSKIKLVIMNERCRKQEKRAMLLKMVHDSKEVPEKMSDKTLNVQSLCSDLSTLKILNSCEDSSQHKDHLCTEGRSGDFPSIPVNSCTNNDLWYTADTDENQETSQNNTKYNDGENGTQVIGGNSQHIKDRVSENKKHPAKMTHSRKFREYCNNVRSKDLDTAVINLLKEIYRFQDRHFKRDPIRAHAKRRFVLGIREVKKFLKLKKLKAIIIAPDLEAVEGTGGLDEQVVEIRDEGKTMQIPVIFAAGRRQLGFAVMKKVPISMIGILNPEGAEAHYSLVLSEWHAASSKYSEENVEPKVLQSSLLQTDETDP